MYTKQGKLAQTTNGHGIKPTGIATNVARLTLKRLLRKLRSAETPRVTDEVVSA